MNLTNYGLIRVDNVEQRLPQSDAYFRYEFLVDVPATLEAKQRITIPYRVVALQSLEGAANSGTASGSGCYSYSYAVTCDFKCANGAQSSCGASTSWFSVSNSSCSGGSGGGCDWGGGGFGCGGSSIPIKMKGKKCVYVPKGGMQCD